MFVIITVYEMCECILLGFIETENEEHFLLRCLHPGPSVLLLAKSCHPLII